MIPLAFLIMIVNACTYCVGIRSDHQNSVPKGGRTCAARPYERHSFRSSEFSSERGTGSLTDPTQTIIFDGFQVPASDQWKLHCDGNIFYNHSTSDAGTDFYNPNSTAVLIKNGAEADVTDNYIGGYGTAIDNQILNNAQAFYCNNFIFQSDACPPRGVGILEEQDPGSVYPKLNTTADLAVGYWAKGKNASTPVANQFGSNNSAFVLSTGNFPSQLLVEIGALQPGTEPGTIGAEFQDQAVTLAYGSHTGPNNFAGFNHFEGNTQSQVELVDDGNLDAQPSFGLYCGNTDNGIYGENVFTAPNGSFHFQLQNYQDYNYQLNYALSENHWNPEINGSSHCHILLNDPNFQNVIYNNIGDGTATGYFICSASGIYKAKKRNGEPLSIESGNPVDPSDSSWLFFEGQSDIDVNNQGALDTLRLFVERYPYFRAWVPNACRYTLQVVVKIADTGVYIQQQPWIDEYNWLVSRYTADTAAWYESEILGDMSSAAEMFDENLAANIDWNMERLFPFTHNTDTSIIGAIRNFQFERGMDTTPFYIMQIPPIPYGVSAVKSSVPQGLTLSTVPNPVNETLTALVSTTFSSPAELELYDALGQQVKSIPSPRLQMGTNEFMFDCSTLPAGNYYLRLAASGTVKTMNVTIQH